MKRNARFCIDKILDSLDVADGKKIVSIKIDDGTNPNTDSDRLSQNEPHNDDKEDGVDDRNGIYRDLKFETEDIRRRLRDFDREFRPKSDEFVRNVEDWGNKMGHFWNREVEKPSNLKGLNVFTNKPNDGVLNVRFLVPTIGDVSIMVTDTKGKEVGKKLITDLEGEFVGQIELDKNTVGTIFVTVVQNDDGAVKRVVLP